MNETKKYVDSAVDLDGNMVMYAITVKEQSGESAGFSVRVSDKDIKRRRITLKERFCNWIILKLGGKLKDCYTTIHTRTTKTYDLWTIPKEYYEEEE